MEAVQLQLLVLLGTQMHVRLLIAIPVPASQKRRVRVAQGEALEVPVDRGLPRPWILREALLAGLLEYLDPLLDLQDRCLESVEVDVLAEVVEHGTTCDVQTPQLKLKNQVAASGVPAFKRVDEGDVAEEASKVFQQVI